MYVTSFVKTVALFIAVSVLSGASGARAAPEVVVSIKPVHSLVAAVMEGVAEPHLLVSGAASPHGFRMKPSQARQLEGADIVFWIGPSLESFLRDPLETIASTARTVSLMNAPGLVHRPFREGGLFEPHDHGHDEEQHDHGHDDDAHEHEDHAEGEETHEHHAHADEEGENDPHIWLDPRNGAAMVRVIERELSRLDPANADLYGSNRDRVLGALEKLEAELNAVVAPARGQAFIVFHDAYRHFEDRFGLRAVGSLTVSPEVAPGAARVRAIREKIQASDAVCLFAEPQFSPKLLTMLRDGTSARAGELDPLGAMLEANERLYFDLMRRMASAFASCLANS